MRQLRPSPCSVATGSRNASNLVELEERRAGEQVADEAHACQQQLGLEAGHVGAVADTRLEHSDQGQAPARPRAASCATGRALREILLLGQPLARDELAGHDQVLDLGDRLVSESCHRALRSRSGSSGSSHRKPIKPVGRPAQHQWGSVPGDGFDGAHSLSARPARSRRSGAPPASRCRRAAGQVRSTRTRPRPQAADPGVPEAGREHGVEARDLRGDVGRGGRSP